MTRKIRENLAAQTGSFEVFLLSSMNGCVTSMLRITRLKAGEVNKKPFFFFLGGRKSLSSISNKQQRR
jgi:hypothetical protein